MRQAWVQLQRIGIVKVGAMSKCHRCQCAGFHPKHVQFLQIRFRSASAETFPVEIVVVHARRHQYWKYFIVAEFSSIELYLLSGRYQKSRGQPKYFGRACLGTRTMDEVLPTCEFERINLWHFSSRIAVTYP